MRATPILVAAFIAAGCSFALAQAGGGGAGGGAAGGGAAGAAAGGAASGAAADSGSGAGVSAGSAGTSAGGATAGTSGTSGIGGDQRAARNFGRFRRGDDMAPLVIPREEAPVRLRTYRQW